VQSKCGRRAIEHQFQLTLLETEWTIWRTIGETERTLSETDAQ